MFLELHFHHISILIIAIIILHAFRVNNMFPPIVKVKPNGEV